MRDASPPVPHELRRSAEWSRASDGARPALLKRRPRVWHDAIDRNGWDMTMMVQLVSAALGAGFSVCMWTMYKHIRELTR